VPSYFEYLFADAGIKKAAKKVSATSLTASGIPKCEFVKSPSGYDFVKPHTTINPYGDPVKRDSRGFLVPDLPASGYGGQARESSRMSYETDNNCKFSHSVTSLLLISVIDNIITDVTADNADRAYIGTPPVHDDTSAFAQFSFPQYGVPHMRQGKSLSLSCDFP
jgi:hypothetical protein